MAMWVGPRMASLARTESFGSGHYLLDQNNNNTSGFGLFNSHNHTMIEKRQVFLRSYQFSRKKSLGERIRMSLVRVKRVIWLRLKSARRFRKLASFRLRCGFSYRRRRFIRLLINNNNHYYKCNNFYYNSSCLW